MRQRNIVIVGGGIAGASLAYALGRRDLGPARVTLVEAEPLFGQHSTGQNAAILRTTIAADTTRRLAHETAAFLAAPPEGFCDHPLLDARGVIVSEGEPGDPLPRWAVDAGPGQGAVQLLTPEQLRQRAPHVRTKGSRDWWVPGDGTIDVAALLEGFLQSARNAGVELLAGAPARLLRDGDRVRGIELAGGTQIEADHTVLASGAWAGALGASCAARTTMQVTRRHLLVTSVDSAIDPAWPVVWDDVAGWYARPESGGMLVCACDQTDVAPDACETDPDVRLTVARKVADHLPDLASAGAAHFWAGLRTLTPDDVPLIGPDADVPGLFWLAGLGGHGITISEAVGRTAADMLTGVPIDDALRHALRPNRTSAAVRHA